MVSDNWIVACNSSLVHDLCIQTSWLEIGRAGFEPAFLVPESRLSLFVIMHRMVILPSKPAEVWTDFEGGQLKMSQMSACL